MPLVHPTHVVSFSSEDPNHPASNLLNLDTYRKWKCKEAGEKEAFVILKFDRAININCVDVGNDGSALVEVSVARSGNGGEPQYEVLLSSNAFMSPLDSREGKNLCGVRSFSLNCLSKPVAAQKWDLVKILVSQPFNRHVQYGLSFIKFTAAPDPDEPEKIGIFSIRKPLGGGNSDDDDDVRPGRLFSSILKSPSKGGASKPSVCLSTNASIRQASAKLTTASKSASEDDVKELLKKPKLDLPSPSTSGSPRNSPLMKKKDLPDPPIKSKDKEDKTKKPSSQPSTGTQQANQSSPKVDTNKSTKKRALSPSPSSIGTSSSPSTSRGGAPSKKPKKARKTKPFNKLFEGVVFAMSGYENPRRGQIRDKAVEMGARYKADWDGTCTHLLCAFINTPKFRQVKSGGKGKIVKKDWIENSYRDRCRYPWRRHCVDRNDKGVESDEEIYAEDEDDEEEMVVDEVDPAVTESNATSNDVEEVNGKLKKKRILVIEDSSDESDKESKKAYEADTDVDDEDRTPDLSPSIFGSTDAPSLPIFENLEFYVCSNTESKNDSKIEREKLESIIVKRKGYANLRSISINNWPCFKKVHKTPTNDVEYYVCRSFEWIEDFSDALSDNPNLIFVHEKWILECDKEDQLIDKDGYLLSPT